MHIAIIEDNTSDYEYVKQLTKEIFANKNYLEITFDYHEDVSSFKKAYFPKCYDLIFLDCYLKNQQIGIDAGKYVRSYGDDVPIIFTSSYDDFAVEGYEIKASGYLLKPISKVKLEKLLESIFFATTPVKIELDNKKSISLNIDDLMCCQSDHHYINILMKNNKTIRLRITLTHLYKQINHLSQLYNCSRGYIVNLNYIELLDKKSFILKNGMTIPISRQLYNEAQKIYQSFIFEKLRK